MAILLVLPVTLSAQTFLQQGNKLVGIGAVGAAQQGGSVAISADGSTLAVGARADDGGLGAVWVFVRDGVGVWSQQGTKLVGSGATGNPALGTSVALSADGNTLVAGGPDDNSGRGAAWVFVRDGAGVWSQQGTKLVGTGSAGISSGMGTAVALSADGLVAAVGGPLDNSQIGAVWVFGRSGSAWNQQGTKLLGANAIGTAGVGSALALNANGTTLLVGGPADNSQFGAAWVFTRSGSTWTAQGGKLVGNDATADPRQGSHLALSGDGNTAVVGGPNDATFAGAAWVYTRSGTTWTQQGDKLVATGAVGAAQLGAQVALAADGNLAALSGPSDNGGAGAVWLYSRTGSVWSPLGSKLTGTGAVGAAQQGTGLALSADGTTLALGGSADASDAGATWVFATAPVTTLERAADYLTAARVGPNPATTELWVHLTARRAFAAELAVVTPLGQPLVTATHWVPVGEQPPLRLALPVGYTGPAYLRCADAATGTHVWVQRVVIGGR
ncbi:MAG: hypothetical protein SFY70_01735 [Bacteroidia bacterium]|nr:hypothetical protein [Bacteroidia bacterium]